MEEFDKFWELWPKKIAKADARKAWIQTKDVRPPLSKILHAIETASKTEQWMKSGGTFIPYPATWLRGERWDDVHEVKLPDVVGEKLWHETASGIEAKGKELGLSPFDYNSFPEFRAAVMQKSLKAA